MSLINQMLLAFNRAQNTVAATKLGLVSSSIIDGGSVSVKVMLQPENIEAGPMPYCVPWAGSNHGFLVAPEIGDHVMVAFQEGSKDVPLGCSSLFWDGATIPADFLIGQALWFDKTGAFFKLNKDGTLTISPSPNSGTYPNAKVLVPGNLAITTAGKGFQVKEGSNAKAGTATLIAGTKTITTTSVTANSRILLQRTSLNGSTAIGELVPTITPGSSFIVNSYSPSVAVVTDDNSTFYYNIFEPA